MVRGVRILKKHFYDPLVTDDPGELYDYVALRVAGDGADDCVVDVYPSFAPLGVVDAEGGGEVGLTASVEREAHAAAACRDVEAPGRGVEPTGMNRAVSLGGESIDLDPRRRGGGVCDGALQRLCLGNRT